MLYKTYVCSNFRINTEQYKIEVSLVSMNKTKDGRIIETRVRIDKEILKKLILEVKDSKKLTWKKFSDNLGVGEQMIKHDWVNKNDTLPLSIFHKLLKMRKKSLSDFRGKVEIKKPFWGQGINKGKKVTIPNVNTEKFAEFYGIMLGDGCIFSDMKGIAITGDKILEKDYYERYLFNLIKDLFDSKPKVFYEKDNRGVRIIFYSRKVCNFLSNVGFPVGLKYNKNMAFPSFILENRSSAAACIRGIMDTDGSLAGHPNTKIMIHLSITSPSLRKSVIDGLKELGVIGGEFNKGIMIYGRDKVNTFYRKIGFSNKKNIIKYNKFLETGRVPTSKETETYLREEKPFFNKAP